MIKGVLKYARQPDAGFSLLELLVAVAILSVGAVSLLENQAGGLRISAAVFDRTLATFVADNRMNVMRRQELGPAPGHSQGTEIQFSTPFRWYQSVSTVAQGDMLRLEVVVRREGDGRDLAKFIGFRRADSDG